MLADPHKLGNPDAFDALADLFLGEDHKVHAHEAAMGLPAARGGGTVDAQALHGPPAQPSGAASASDTPRLVLTTDRGPDSSAPSVPPGIEALVLGHLPVMAAAWATQYARHAADRVQAPIAFVRLASGIVRIELFAPAGSDAQARACSTLVAATDLVRRSAARVIVMTDHGAEADLAQAAGVDRVTLLTSGDEAGIVGAYGIVKTLAQRLKAAHGPGAERALRVAVMGAPPARADFVVDRLRDAARAFLALDLQPGACIPRIGPGAPGVEVFAGPAEGPHHEVLELLRTGTLVQPAPFASIPAEPATQSPAATCAQADPIQPEPQATQPSADPSPSHIPQPQLRARQQSATGFLSCFLPGFEALAARCPHAEEIELALDPDGRVHALGRAEEYGQRSRVLERLVIAAAWAQAHRKLLQLTLGESGPQIDGAAPIMHAFTDQPAAWRTLLDTPVRVHMLAPVDPGAAWACAPVN